MFFVDERLTPQLIHLSDPNSALSPEAPLRYPFVRDMETTPPPVPSAIPPIPETAPVATVAKWRWLIHLLIVGPYPIWIGLLSHYGFRSIESGGPALGGNVSELMKGSLLTLATFFIPFGLAWIASRATLDDLRLRWKGGFKPFENFMPRSLAALGTGVVYSIALRIGAVLPIGIIIGALMLFGKIQSDGVETYITENRPNVEAIVDVASLRNDPAYLILMLTFVSFVVAGLREELWRSATLAGMERLFPGGFGTKIGRYVAVLIIAVAFGLGHLPQGPMGVVLTGFLGVGLGVIIVFHGSIWPAVIAHGLFDATSFALIPYALELMKKVQPVTGH